MVLVDFAIEEIILLQIDVAHFMTIRNLMATFRQILMILTALLLMCECTTTPSDNQGNNEVHDELKPDSRNRRQIWIPQVPDFNDFEWSGSSSGLWWHFYRGSGRDSEYGSGRYSGYGSGGYIGNGSGWYSAYGSGRYSGYGSGWYSGFDLGWLSGISEWFSGSGEYFDRADDDDRRFGFNEDDVDDDFVIPANSGTEPKTFKMVIGELSFAASLGC